MSTRWVVVVDGTPAEIYTTEADAYRHAARLTWNGVDNVIVEEFHFPLGYNGLSEDR